MAIFDKLGGDTSGLMQSKPMDMTKQVSSIAATGVSGKVQPSGSGPKESALGESAAVAAVQTNLNQIAQQKQQQVSNQQFNSLQLDREASVQNRQLDQNFLDVRQNFNVQSNQLLGEFERGQKSLSNAKDIASLEQLGKGVRLANDKYIFDLQTEGEKARLDNNIAFEEALQKSVFSDQTELQLDNLGFAKMYAMTDAEFAKVIGEIDINQALSIFNTKASAAEGASTVSGIGTGIGVALPYAYNAYQSRTPETGSTLGNTSPGPVASSSPSYTEGTNSNPSLNTDSSSIASYDLSGE